MSFAFLPCLLSQSWLLVIYISYIKKNTHDSKKHWFCVLPIIQMIKTLLVDIYNYHMSDVKIPQLIAKWLFSSLT